MMTRMCERILFMVFFFPWLLFFPGEVRGESGPIGTPGSPITMLAEQLEQRMEEHLVIGQGFVDIRFKDFRVQSDHVKLNTLTGDGMASGNVIIHDGANRISCDSMEFNLHTRLGVMREVSGFVSETYYVTGKKLERLSEDRYKIQDGTVSTCEGDTPPWSFHSQEVVVKLDKYVMLKHPSLWVKKIPALYAPLFFMPLSERKRGTGFLTPSFGLSNRDGITLKDSFFWAISDQTDATIGLDYLGKRGIRPNMEYRYFLDKDTSGKVRTSFLQDKRTDGNFFKLDMDHRQKFQNGAEGLLRIDMVSQDDGDKEFEEEIGARTRRYSNSFASLKKNWENHSVQFYAEHIEGIRSDSQRNDREAVLAKLPELSYTYFQKSLAHTPLFLQLDSSLVDLYRERNETRPDKTWESHRQNDQVLRMDFFPQLSLPIRGLPGATLVPKIGFRETFFNQLTGEGEGQDRSSSRELMTFESRVEGPKAYRTFAIHSGRLTAIKHLIEPRILYQYTQDLGNSYDGSRKRIPFDRIDSFGPQHTVGFSLINRFLAKEQVKENRFTSREVARLEVSQITHLNRDWVGVDNRRPFSSLNFDLETHLFPFLEFNSDASINLDEGAMSSNSQQVKVKWPGLGFISVDRRYFKLSEEENKWWSQTGFLWSFAEGRREEFYNIDLGIDFFEHFKLQLGSRFDASKGTRIENRYNFLYRGSCFDLGIDLSDRRGKLEFNFFVSLQGLGSFGTGRHNDRFPFRSKLITED